MKVSQSKQETIQLVQSNNEVPVERESIPEPRDCALRP